MHITSSNSQSQTQSPKVCCAENSGLLHKGQEGEVPQCGCAIKQYCVSLKDCSDKNIDHSAALETLIK